MTPDLIYHITSAAQWASAQAAGAYRVDTLESEGFIHASVGRQVAGTAKRFYRGRAGLVILCIDPDKLTAELRFEAADNGDFFPHIYGPLNMDAVVEVVDFPVSADGTFQLPAQIRT